MTGLFQQNDINELPYFSMKKPAKIVYSKCPGYRFRFRRRTFQIYEVLLLLAAVLFLYYQINSFLQQPASVPLHIDNFDDETPASQAILQVQENAYIKKEQFIYPETPHYKPQNITGPFAVPSVQCHSSYDYGLVDRLAKGKYAYCNGQNELQGSTKHFDCFRTERDYTTGSRLEHVVNMFCAVNGSSNIVTSSRGILTASVGCPNARLPSDRMSKERSASYMYETGLTSLMRSVRFNETNNVKPTAVDQPVLGSTDSFTIFFKRDGPGNLYHFLNEALALYVTRHVLALHSTGDAHVVIIDTNEPGPYKDVWAGFGPWKTHSVSYIGEFSRTMTVINPVWALSGGDGPFWKCNWPQIDCGASQLILDFRSDLMHVFNVSATQRTDRRTIKMVIIGRRGPREILGLERLIALVRASAKIPSSLSFEVTEVFFENLEFGKQIEIAHEADILLAVHGAGLAHSLWLDRNSAVIELYPYNFIKYGFANMGQLVGARHFPVSTPQIPGSQEKDYHREQVLVHDPVFIDVVQAALNFVISEKYMYLQQ